MDAIQNLYALLYGWGTQKIGRTHLDVTPANVISAWKSHICNYAMFGWRSLEHVLSKSIKEPALSKSFTGLRVWKARLTGKDFITRWLAGIRSSIKFGDRKRNWLIWELLVHSQTFLTLEKDVFTFSFTLAPLSLVQVKSTIHNFTTLLISSAKIAKSMYCNENEWK